MEIDEKLEDWNELSDSLEHTGIIVGNGASMAVWESFCYPSLFGIARQATQTSRLLDEDVALFEAFSTTNFELVLSTLVTARMVNASLGHDVETINERYRSIQSALAEAVKSVHVPWIAMPIETLNAIRAALIGYDIVYSTNFDLLIYWAINHVDPAPFKDLFWAEDFDPANTEVRGEATVVFYLHGGLHLYRTSTRGTKKRRATAGQNLLDLFGTPMTADSSPLCICEGTATDKLDTIYGSNYLRFAYSALRHHAGALCVFGHSLGESDSHIVDAIRTARIREVSVSVRPAPRADVIRTKASFYRCLPEVKLRFYDSTTHPLGDIGLRVPNES